MADTRTLREKLEAMASQDVSPHEAAIAQAKLASMGDEPPPPRRPTAVGAAPGQPGPWVRWTSTTTVQTGQGTVTWTIEIF